MPAIGADLVRINGKTITRGRALAMGWVDPKGNVTAKGDEAFTTKPADRKPASNKARQAARAAGEPETTADGVFVKRKRVEPLKPRNVKNGKPIEDEAELARIAAETEAIEAAATAEREAAEA